MTKSSSAGKRATTRQYASIIAKYAPKVGRDVRSMRVNCTFAATGQVANDPSLIEYAQLPYGLSLDSQLINLGFLNAAHEGGSDFIGRSTR